MSFKSDTNFSTVVLRSIRQIWKWSCLTILFTGNLTFSQVVPKLDLPTQEPPPKVEDAPSTSIALEIGPQTNLVTLLKKVRDLSSSGNFTLAQEIASSALSNLELTEQNEFYLTQIKSEETKLYFKLANLAMQDKDYSLASQYIERYRTNVAEDLAERKVRRSVKQDKVTSRDVSLVGRLVEELDQAKKDLAQIRAKSGLPESDAKPDLDRLVREEKSNIEVGVRKAEVLLRRAKLDASQGRYELADQQIDQALSSLSASAGTIAIINDLFKAKQEVV